MCSNLRVLKPTRLVYYPPCQSDPLALVSQIRNPYPEFPGRFHDFHGCLYPGLGRSHGGFPDLGCLDLLRTQAPHQCARAHGSNIGPPTLGLSITGPLCYDCYRHYHSCTLPITT